MTGSFFKGEVEAKYSRRYWSCILMTLFHKGLSYPIDLLRIAANSRDPSA